jgi:hypothetical protein
MYSLPNWTCGERKSDDHADFRQSQNDGDFHVTEATPTRP